MLSVIGCKATSQGLNITGKWLSRKYCWVGNREKTGQEKGGNIQPTCCPVCPGLFLRFIKGVGLTGGGPLAPLPLLVAHQASVASVARWPPSTHCVFRAIGLAPCQRCGQLPVQLTGRHDHGGRLRNSQTSKISKVLSTLIPLSLSRLKLL